MNESTNKKNQRVASLPDGAVFIDKEYRPISEAKISMLDFGFTRSDATYDVVHVWQGAFFRLEDHLDRFFRSLERAQMSIDHDRDEVRDILIECVRLTGLRDVYVAMVCTRGLPSKTTRDPRQCVNRFYAYAVPFIWIATPDQRKNGMHMVIASIPRTPAKSVDPTVKNYNWRDMARGLFEAFERGGETVVMLDNNGFVNEGPGFNIFTVTNNKISTPNEGVLEGITRLAVINICEEEKIPFSLARITADELLDADEIFITSTAGGIMPVTRLNGHVLGNGAPGPLTEKIRTSYWDKHQEARYQTQVFYD